MFRLFVCFLIVPLMLANQSLSIFAHVHQNQNSSIAGHSNSSPHIHLNHHHHHDHDPAAPTHGSKITSLDLADEHDNNALYLVETNLLSNSDHNVKFSYESLLEVCTILRGSLVCDSECDLSALHQTPQDDGHSAPCPVFLRTLSIRI